MKKTEILVNKPVCLGLLILGLSKILMYEFWYDYVKPKFSEKAKLCYIDTNSFIWYIERDETRKHIAGDVETRFHTSNYELYRPLSKGRKSNWINERWIRQKNSWTKSKSW